MKVSVCIAAYNGAKYIRQQLESILLQLTDNDEVIVSDDGSTDGTLDIIASFKDERIKIYHHNEKPSRLKHYNILNVVTRNFEYAMSKATGDCIFLSDQDDIWYPNKVEKTLTALKEHDFVISSYSKIDASGNPTGHNKTSARFDKRLKRNFVMQWLQGPYFGCVCAMNRRFLEFAMPIPAYPIHDRYLGLLAKRMGVLFHLEEPLIMYRRHGNNNSSAEKNSLILKIWLRIKLLYYVLIRPYQKKY